MGVKQILHIEAESAIDKVINIPFEFKNVPKGKNTGDHITISPITVRTWFQLKPLLVMIDKEDIDVLKVKKGSEFDSELIDVMMKYDSLLFEIICIGIHNKEGDMPKWFREVLADSCSWEDLYILLNAVLFRLGSTSFSNSIIALKAVSPFEEEEIIALQENKTKWNSKAASPF